MATETIDVEAPDDIEALCPNAEDLLETDGEPLDSPWHRAAINLLIESMQFHLQGRTDYFVGGNMFIYYCRRQAKSLSYRGPDFFYVKDVDGTRERRFWLVWDEDGKYPNTIIELLSPRTAKADRTTKKTIYEQTFRTPEYFLYDPRSRRLEGWLLKGAAYEAVAPGADGRLWSEQLGLWLGTWEGPYQNQPATWLRFFDPQDGLVHVSAEAVKIQAGLADTRARAAEIQAQTAEQRAQAAEAELALLKVLLLEKGVSSSSQNDASK